MLNDDTEEIVPKEIKTNKRKHVKYTNSQITKINNYKAQWDLQLKDVTEGDQDNNIEGHPIFQNQREIGDKIAIAYKNNDKLLISLVVASTQSGKTGVSVALIDKFIDIYDINIKTNVFIITGLSDCSWVEQTKERIPEIMRNHVFHRNHLVNDKTEQFQKKLKLAGKNILIIIDEVHLASSKNNDIYKAFEKAGLVNLDYLFNNDIKIVEFSATPCDGLTALQKWKEHTEIFKLKNADNYMGGIDLYNLSRVKQFKNLTYEEKKKNLSEVEHNIRELKTNYIENFDNKDYSIPGYSIIRTKGLGLATQCKEDFIRIFDRPDKYDFINFDSNNELKDLKNLNHYLINQLSDEDIEKNNFNALLKIKPKKHTFIFIKDKFRCAKTLNKKHLNLVYERFVDMPSLHVIIQGLLGRCCGYDDNGRTLIYTDLNTIKEYDKYIKNIDTIDWDKNIDNNFNSAKIYGAEENTKTDISEEEDKFKRLYIEKFKTREELIQYFKLNLDTDNKVEDNPEFIGRVPSKKMCGTLNKDNNLYEKSHAHKKIGDKWIRLHNLESMNDLTADCINNPTKYNHYQAKRNINDSRTKWGKTHKGTQFYDIFPVYNNSFDKDSEEFWIVYKFKGNWYYNPK